jgi:hypothetical protein
MGDLLFGMTDWLRGTALLDLAFWLQETSVSLFMVENFWMVPIAQVFHILSIGAAFGATLMLTLRINGRAGTSLTMGQIGARYMPWIWWGLLVIAISGTLMATAEPVRNMVNAVFWIKMVLIVVMIALTLSFVGSVRRKALAAGPGWQASGGTRSTSWVIVLLWCLIMVCGRWIAYVPV